VSDKKWGGRKKGYYSWLTREKVKAVRALLKSGVRKAEIAWASGD
jgi:hypothetical protein